ncbi:hypothetical protein CSKR_109355 [Clonorchis sinensis]|uniref:Uncharacterized protein n=1 Tax=Clonorchis sinensis TaxID=79923 RepID=A0A3R7C5F3_CLOSI|nr:hypothetical protein CSKR_109355 [Clonorchis sinensis]
MRKSYPQCSQAILKRNGWNMQSFAKETIHMFAENSSTPHECHKRNIQLGFRSDSLRKMNDISVKLIPKSVTIEQGSKTLICISLTKLNIHLLLARVFLNFPGYSLTVAQMQAHATKRLHKFRNRPHFSRHTKPIYEKTYCSHASSVVSTVTSVAFRRTAGKMDEYS